jgi:hypothetical protein
MGRASTKDIEIVARDFEVQYLMVNTSIESSTRPMMPAPKAKNISPLHGKYHHL